PACDSARFRPRLLRLLSACRRGGRLERLEAGRDSQPLRPRGHGLLRDAQRGRGLLRRLNRLVRVTLSQRLREQRLPDNRERSAKVRERLSYVSFVRRVGMTLRAHSSRASSSSSRSTSSRVL